MTASQDFPAWLYHSVCPSPMAVGDPFQKDPFANSMHLRETASNRRIGRWRRRVRSDGISAGHYRDVAKHCSVATPMMPWNRRSRSFTALNPVVPGRATGPRARRGCLRQSRVPELARVVGFQQRFRNRTLAGSMDPVQRLATSPASLPIHSTGAMRASGSPFRSPPVNSTGQSVGSATSACTARLIAMDNCSHDCASGPPGTCPGCGFVAAHPFRVPSP